MNKIFSIIAALTASLFLSACATPAPLPVQNISFTNYPAINIDVASIEVVEEYKSPLRTPNVEHLMPYSPAAAMKIWSKDRLKATGSAKLLQVAIIDAPVTVTDLPKTQGINGLFTNDQDKRYDARLEVELRIYGDSALSEASTNVVVTRSITIAENASVNVRKAAYNQLIFDLMKMLNEKLEKNMQEYMNNHINFANH